MKPDQQTTAQFKSVKDIEKNARGRMDKVMTDLQNEMAHIRTGRASVNLLDSIKIEYYGTPTIEPGKRRQDYPCANSAVD
jgi:hypothetical protein